MAHPNRHFIGFRQFIAVTTLLVAGTVGACAQTVVVFVNGEPITALDVEHRIKLVQITTQKTPSRQETIEDLINEKLKVREAKRWSIELTDAEVDNTFEGMAKRARATPEQLAQNLAKQGTTAATLKARIRAESVWQQLVRGRYRERLQLNEKDIEGVVIHDNKSDEPDAVYDYVMRTITFLVPPGSPPAVYEARRKDAEALRARFKTCVEGLEIARSFRDIAVQNQVVRSTGDMPEPVRKVIESTPVGQLTPPDMSRLGVEMVAVCSKEASKADAPAKRQARDTVFAKKFEQVSKEYLDRLRRESLIEYVSGR
jgi:peptidyl-prolyl cis-trans isomerase SurA